MSNKIKVFTTFSGYDSQCLGLDRLKEYDKNFDYELIGWSEIESNAIKAHNALYPEYKDRNYGDITKIDWSEVEDIDLFTYSSPCFPGDVQVLTTDGFVRFDEMKEYLSYDDAYVLTHNGQFKKILKYGSKPYNDDLYTIRCSFSEVKCTKNHPFYVRHKYEDGTLSEPVWLAAEHIKNTDYLAHVHHKKETQYNYGEDTKAFYYILGRIAGEPNQNKFSGLSVTIRCNSTSETEKLYKALERTELNYTPVLENNVSKYKIELNYFNKLVREHHKMNYSLVANSDSITLTECFLNGFKDSLSVVDANGAYLYKSGNEAFIYTLGHCISKVYDRPFRVDKLTDEQKNIVYRLSWSEERDIVDVVRDGDIYWYPVKSVSYQYEETTVHNIEVEDDHSYTANTFGVHNCQSFSSAGNQHGGEEGSGTRSSLLWEVKKCIAIKKPKFLLLENVTALVSEKFIDLFNKWIQTVNSYGYKSYWKVLNASDFGLPQNRERVFLVSVRNDIDLNYTFPEPVETRRPHLYEYLEPDDKVDPKLFRSDFRRNKILEFKEKQVLKLESDSNNKLPGRYDLIPSGVYCHCSDKFIAPPLLDLARTLKAECIDSGIYYKKDGQYYMRLFTHRELYRLMGLRDEEYDKIKEAIPLSPQAKCAGNSICVDVLFHLFRKMFTDKEPDKNSSYVLF